MDTRDLRSLNTDFKLYKSTTPLHCAFNIMHLLHQIQGKVNIYSLFCVLCQFYLSTSIKIEPELKKNVFNFGYGINYKYEGMLAHSFDRFYAATKFILPTIEDLNFLKLNYDMTPVCTWTTKMLKTLKQGNIC